MLPPRAYLFIGLNAARALSLITLILVFASTIVVMVNDIHAIKKGMSPPPSGSKTVSINGTDYYYDCDYLENSTVPLQPGGSMFAIINHLFIIFQVILLTLSEIGWPASFFDNHIPVLGKQHGVGILGFFQIFIAAGVLSHHVSTFALVSAFFLFAVGVLNVLLGLTFRASIKSKRSLLSWRDRAPTLDQLPRTTADFKSQASSYVGAKAAGVFGNGATSVFANMTGASSSTQQQPGMQEKQHTGASTGYGFGRQGEKHAGLKGFLISKPVESLPRYVPKPGGGVHVATQSRSSSRASSRSDDSDHDHMQDPPKVNRI